MLMPAGRATRWPHSIARLALDFVLFYSVVVSLPILRLTRYVGRPRS
jgi:hypothetical protein